MQYFKKWLIFLYSFFDFLYSNNKKVDNDADIEANNVSEENAIIIDFSYVCDMDYTAAKVLNIYYFAYTYVLFSNREKTFEIRIWKKNILGGFSDQFTI